MMFQLQCLVTCEVHSIILLAILRVSCLIKLNTLHTAAALTKVCIFLKSSALLKAISTYYTTLLSSRIRSFCKYVTPFVLVPNKDKNGGGQ